MVKPVLPFPEERAMNESTKYTQTSGLARASHHLGVLALLLLMLSGCCIVGLACVGRPGGPTQEEVIGLAQGAVFCQGLAVVAALAALILGILGLADVGRGAGKVKGTGLAVSGLVTATLTVLTVVLVYGVVLLALASTL
jgi:hypothetical protein